MIELEAVKKKRIKWDNYYHSICEKVGENSLCLSRKIGAILVRDKIIVATGYNGPPRGIPHCGEERLLKDKTLPKDLHLEEGAYETCPRKVMGYSSGKGMEICTATHAEVNCIINAARLGVPVSETTMYMNCIVSCFECMKVLINSGIKELVVEITDLYQGRTQFLIDNSNISIRTFRKE